MYTSAFRRLAGVTQVVGPLTGHVVHNRLTHTLEAAQIARRIAEKLIKQSPALVAQAGGVDPDVVEAAAFAHDLGHPPFGHIGEQELDRLARSNKAPDGFEGNAQSFRIVTRLAAHRKDYRGLDLTQATLNAMLKYPWERDLGNTDSKKHRKFGAYRSDGDDFRFARAGSSPDTPSIEAQIMDHSDAIAYSVHDLDDFYRMGLIPLDLLRYEKSALTDVLAVWAKEKPDIADDIENAQPSFLELLKLLPTDRRYVGTYADRIAMRSATAWLINNFVGSIELESPSSGGTPVLRFASEPHLAMKFLQRLVWYYVIDNPRLATQQHGERKIIDTLFQVYYDAVTREKSAILPAAFHEELRKIDHPDIEYVESIDARQTRLAVDIVASFADSEATLLYRRLTGTAPALLADSLLLSR